MTGAVVMPTRLYRVWVLLFLLSQTIYLVESRRVSRRVSRRADQPKPGNASLDLQNSTVLCLCTNLSISAAKSTQRRDASQTNAANSTLNSSNETLSSFNGTTECVCEKKEQSGVFPLIVSIVQV